jgi:hypothetical protein
MNNNIDEELAKLDRKIKYGGLIDFPGVVALGVGLYAKFGSDGNPVHPLLADEIVVNGLIGAGVIIMVLAGIRLFRLISKRNKLRAEKVT